jgi:hypothetical protein
MDIIHPDFYLKHGFEDWVLSPSSGGTYSVELNGYSYLLSPDTATPPVGLHFDIQKPSCKVSHMIMRHSMYVLRVLCQLFRVV